MSDDNKNLYYQTLVDTINREAKYFDNAILTLSTGGVGLILTIIKESGAELGFYLKTSSVLFLTTIIMILLSSVASSRSHRKALDEHIKNNTYDHKMCMWNKINNIATPFSFFLFFFACVFLVLKFW